MMTTRVEPLDPESPHGRETFERLGEVFAVVAERIARRKAAEAREAARQEQSA